jgi:hypothetical protein
VIPTINLGSDYRAVDSTSSLIPMTESEAAELARQTAADKQWTWLEPVRVTKKRRWFRCVGWVVESGADGCGCNVWVEIDDATRRVTRAVFLPR